MSNIIFYPYIPITFLYIVIFVSLFITFINYKLKSNSTFFKFLFMLIIILSLANPVIMSENRESLPDTVAVILDLSPSQSINDRKKNALEVYENLKNQLGKINNLEVRYKTINGEKGTNIFNPLSSLIGDIPDNRLAGAIIITDGQIQDVPEINALNNC